MRIICDLLSTIMPPMPSLPEDFCRPDYPLFPMFPLRRLPDMTNYTRKEVEDDA